MTTPIVALEAAKAAPPVVVTAWITMVTSDIDLWIKVLTLVYLVLQVAWFVRKHWSRKKDEE